MTCTECFKEVRDCTCPDIDQRLEDVAKGGLVVMAFCTRCKKHHERCSCPPPNTFTIRGL